MNKKHEEEKWQIITYAARLKLFELVVGTFDTKK
jgi:hypothetical protein